MEIERWKVIPEWQDYAVSDHGHAKRVTGGPGAFAGRLLNPITNLGGYLQVKLGAKGPICTVHSLVLAQFVGPRPTGAEINHKNGNKRDNRLENLEYMTHMENDVHANLVLGVKPRGTKHGMSKLTDAKVREIRRLRKEGQTLWAIANRYGITAANVDYISKGLTWAHVK
jgi:HNH endonuclease/NUMOD4 motif